MQEADRLPDEADRLLSEANRLLGQTLQVKDDQGMRRPNDEKSGNEIRTGFLVQSSNNRYERRIDR